MLVEEARFRWLGICEDEDVMIDDISAIIIEMGSLEPEWIQTPSNEANQETSEF